MNDQEDCTLGICRTILGLLVRGLSRRFNDRSICFDLLYWHVMWNFAACTKDATVTACSVASHEMRAI